MTEPRSRAALFATYLLAALVGYFAGTQGAFGASKTRSADATPRARVGFALRESAPKASPEGWQRLRRDVALVHDSLPESDRAVFELVSAYYAARDYEQALATVSPLLQARADEGRLLSLAGHSLLQLRRLERRLQRQEGFHLLRRCRSAREKSYRDCKDDQAVPLCRNLSHAK